MMKNKIDGNTLSRALLKQLKSMIEQQQMKKLPEHLQHPRLGIILIGENPSSRSYIKKKRNFARRVGIKTRLFNILGEKKEAIKTQLEQKIAYLNKDPRYHGILMQLPFPSLISQEEDYYLNKINPDKDVDCLTSFNRQRMNTFGENALILPCTPLGILKMLDSRKITIKGKSIVIIGKGKLVGDPLERLLSMRQGQVQTFDVRTPIKQIRQKTIKADLLFSATGVPDLVTEQHLKKGCVVIDIGVSSNPKKKGQIRGDISQQTKKTMCQFYSPVPKGVGPMTVNTLMYNIFAVWKRKIQSHQN